MMSCSRDRNGHNLGHRSIELDLVKLTAALWDRD